MTIQDIEKFKKIIAELAMAKRHHQRQNELR